jgi:chromate transporter
VLWITLTAFGGPQAHMAMYIDILVKKRHYLTEEELIELNALCHILPGPTSTQTITAIGFRRGGATLAYLTLLIWILPAVTLMTFLGLIANYLHQNDISLDFLRFIQPMAVGLVAYAAYQIVFKVVKTKTAFALMVFAGVVSFLVRNPWTFPLLLLAAGCVTAFKFNKQEKSPKSPLKIEWSNFILYLSVFFGMAILGGLTHSLGVRLFENFYRNGSLIFGGGQVLIPALYTEFVEFKHYLTSEEFISGYALVQAVPGPVFSFSAYVGAIAMGKESVSQGVFGGLIASVGIFLPGTFLIFFVIRFWDQLKKYRVVRASLEGINGASAGLVIAGVFLLAQPIDMYNIINPVLMLSTFLLLIFTKIPTPVIIGTGLVLGFIL